MWSARMDFKTRFVFLYVSHWTFAPLLVLLHSFVIISSQDDFKESVVLFDIADILQKATEAPFKASCVKEW